MIWILLAVGAVGALRFFCLADRLYYVPSAVLREIEPRQAGLACEDIAFTTKDGLTLPGWLLLARAPRRGVVLHLHGNAANRANHWPLVSFLPPSGFEVVVFDYGGYGGAPGRPTREGLYQDAQAALDFAAARAGGEVPLFLFGQSLGATLALVLAAELGDRIAGVVAEAPFTSHRAIAAEVLRGLVLLPPLANAIAWILVRPGFDADAACDRIGAPVLLVHGTADPVVPARMSTELAHHFDDGRAEIYLIDGGSHLDLLDCGAAYSARIIGFLERCVERDARRR